MSNTNQQAEKVKARVLVDTVIDGEPCKPNDIVTLDAKTAASMSGQVDADPAAVKYAESLKRKAKSEEEEG